ncbi:Rid family hydrolase [Roseobacteraceae bacterium S113]
MSHSAVFPAGVDPEDIALKLSPAVRAGDHLYITGMTGVGADGVMPADPAEQFEAAFAKIGAVLAGVDADFSAVVELVSYHVEINAHFDVFAQVHGRFVTAPYPAWTAVEVAGLRRPGALVEVRATAFLG